MWSPVCFPEPHAGFKIAFNMFDADGNQMVDKREFLVVSVTAINGFTRVTKG